MFSSLSTYFLRFYCLMNKFSPPEELLNSVKFLSEKYGDIPPPKHEEGNSQDYISESYYINNSHQDIPEAELSILQNIQLTIKEKTGIIKALAKIYPKASIIQSGDFYYPAGGFMSWHTNSNTPGRRVYITYSQEANKNIFKYIDDGKVIEDFDEEGWTVREFIVGDTPDTLFWHAVDAVIPRISMGFRVFDNLA